MTRDAREASPATTGRMGPYPGAYLLLLAAGAATTLWGPAIRHAGHCFLGAESVDHYGTQWFYWFVARALETGTSLEHTRLLFFPFGKDILTDTGVNILDAILAVPFRWALGPVLGYNLFVLLGWILGGIAAWWLARQFVGSHMAAASAALLYTLAPFGLYELEAGRPTQGLMGLLPIYLGLLWRLGRSDGWRAPSLAGMVLGLIGYQYWFYAIFLALISVAHAISRFTFPPPGAGGRVRVLGRHALAGSIAIALALPVAGPMLLRLSQDTPNVPGLLRTDLWTTRATPTVTREGHTVALMVWQPMSMSSGHYWQERGGAERYMPFQHSVSWLAIPWLLLWLYRPGRLDRKTGLLILGTATLIAVGPAWIAGRTSLPNWPYLWLAQHLPPLARLWWPGRAAAIITTLLVPMTAIGLTHLGGPRRHMVLLLIAVSATTWELHHDALLPFPSWDSTIPAGYRCLAIQDQDKTRRDHESRPGAILELPYGWTQAHLYYQTAHGRPIFGGMLEDNPSFTPPGTESLKENNTFVAALLAAARRRPAAPPAPRDREAIARLGYQYVVLQLDAYWTPPRSPGRLTDDTRRAIRRDVQDALQHILGPPVYQDARLVIFDPWRGEPPCQGTAWPKDRVPAPPPPPERHLAGSLTNPAFEVHRFHSRFTME